LPLNRVRNSISGLREGCCCLPESGGVLWNIQHAVGVLAFEANTSALVQITGASKDAHALSIAPLRGRVAEDEG